MWASILARLATFGATNLGKGLVNALPWILAGIVAFIIAYGGWRFRGVVDAAHVAQVEKAAQELRTETAAGAANTLALASKMKDDNRQQIDDLRAFISTQLAEIPARVREETVPQYTELRRILNASGDKYACLFIPYPDAGLQLYARPGGVASPPAR